MTVNIIYLTKYGTAHASDSLFTDLNNTKVTAASGKAKIVPVTCFSGAISWFGKSNYPGWNALTWLTEKSEKAAGKSPDVFASEIATDLEPIFWGNQGAFLPPGGMGIHFTFYEKIGDKFIPELIWITNLNSITVMGAYKPENGATFVAQRQTFHNITGDDKFDEHKKDSYREVVLNYLNLHGPRLYQNGDLLLTGSSDLTEQTIVNLIARKELNTNDPLRLYGKRALFRAEVAALSQKVFSQQQKIKVEAPCFNLMITPDGKYISDTGGITGVSAS